MIEGILGFFVAQLKYEHQGGSLPGVAVGCIVVPWGKLLLQHPACCQRSVTASCGDAFDSGVPRVLPVCQPWFPKAEEAWHRPTMWH